MKLFTIHDTNTIRDLLAGKILTKVIPVTADIQPSIYNCPLGQIGDLLWVQEPFGKSKAVNNYFQF